MSGLLQRAGDLFSRVRPGYVLGGTASGSLVTGVSGSSLSRFVQGTIDSDSIGLLATVTANYLLPSAVLTRALSAALVLGVIYFYVDDIYLERATALTRRRGFRALTAAVSGTVAFFFSNSLVIETADPLGIGRAAWLIFSIPVGTVAFGLYILAIELDPFDPDGELVGMLSASVGVGVDELFEAMRETTGLWRRMYAAVHVVLFGLVFFVPCLFFGFGTVILLSLYPIPELALLAGLLTSSVGRWAGVQPLTPSKYDVEQRLYRPLDDATRNLKGTVLTVLCLANAAVYAGLFVPTVEAARSLLAGVAEVVSDPFLASWREVVPLLSVAVGAVVILFGGALCGALFWFQELRRLPAYTAHWERNQADEAPEPPSPSANRVLGTFVCGNLLLVVGILYAASDPEIGNGLGDSGAVFVLAWITLSAATGWVAPRELRGDPQSATRELRVVLAGMAVQLATFFVIAVATGTAPLRAAVLTVGLGAGIAFVVWIPEILHWTDDRGPVGDLAFASVLFAVAVLVLWLSYQQLPDAFPITAAILVVIGLLLLASGIKTWRSVDEE